MARPEKSSSALEYYTEEETEKYTRNKHIRKIQTQMTQKCIEILEMGDGVILDIGCGSGHSLTAIQDYSIEQNIKNTIIGLDINDNMLKLCKNEEVSLICYDIGNGLPFFPGSFDYIISISCLQWLFYPINKEKIEDRIKKFFFSLYSVMKRESSACFQIYFESKWQIELLLKIIKKTGFIGGLIREGEGKKQKYFLLLDCIKKKRKIKFIEEKKKK
ncbi:deoxyhypusine hydroxylase monooxygenase, partial [Pseudoloma neurophilia]